MRCFLIFLSSFLVVLAIIPPIIAATLKSRMLDQPLEGRKVHKLNIPSSGGIAIFIGFLFSCLIFIPFNLLPQANVLMAAAMLVFIMGLKDDIDGLEPYKKFIAQFVAAIMVSVLADIRITNLYGVMGVYELSFVISVMLTTICFVGIVNAFNLIDGIDGLAGCLGVLLTLLFTLLFYKAGQVGYAYLSIGLTGALIGFLRFNFTPAKIFMGDSGSLLLGFIMAVLSVRITNKDVMSNLMLGSLQITSGIGLVTAILIIPLFDTLRVFTLRIYKGKSPFTADDNHLHHRLLFLGFNHTQSTMILIFNNLIFIGIALLLQNIGNTMLMVLILILALSLNSLLSIFFVRHKRISYPKRDNIEQSFY